MYIYLSKFSSLFHQDILSITASFEEAVSDVLESFKGKERDDFKKEVKTILSDDSISFLDTWKETGSSFGFSSESDARKFLKQIYEMI